MSVARIGRSDPTDQVNKAIASVKLEGLSPSATAVELAEAVAAGRISGEEAIRALTAEHKVKTRPKGRAKVLSR